jgi:hypothetical protein
MTPKPSSPRSRALDLAIPVASCAGAGVGTGHLLAGLSRDELAALVDVLALAASSDPVRLRAVVSAGDGMTAALPLGGDLERLRAAHAVFTRLTRAGLPVPPELKAANGRYQAMVRRRRLDVAAVQKQRRGGVRDAA